MSEWIAVCGEEGDNPIEIETEDGNLCNHMEIKTEDGNLCKHIEIKTEDGNLYNHIEIENKSVIYINLSRLKPSL